MKNGQKAFSFSGVLSLLAPGALPQNPSGSSAPDPTIGSHSMLTIVCSLCQILDPPLQSNTHLFSKSPFTYDITHRLSDSARFSVGVVSSLSSSDRRSPLLSIHGGVAVLSTFEVEAELAAAEQSACCAIEFDRDELAAPRAVSCDAVGHFCSSVIWHCTACRNDR